MIEREKLVLPHGADKLLLHSCCAPCSGEVMEALLYSGIDFSIFFIIRIFILYRNMKYENRKTLRLPKSTIFLLLMQIMTKTTGLHA